MKSLNRSANGYFFAVGLSLVLAAVGCLQPVNLDPCPTPSSSAQVVNPEPPVVTQKGDAGTTPSSEAGTSEAGTTSNALCTGSGNSCRDNGCRALGGACKGHGDECVCELRGGSCNLTSSQCLDRHCEDIGGQCEFVGHVDDCVCVKHRPAPSGNGNHFQLEPGAGDVMLVYLEGQGTCTGMGTSFEEMGKLTITGDSNLTLVSPGRERVGQIDPTGAFFVRDAQHEYVGKIDAKGNGHAVVTYTGGDGCTMQYQITITGQQ